MAIDRTTANLVEQYSWATDFFILPSPDIPRREANTFIVGIIFQHQLFLIDFFCQPTDSRGHFYLGMTQANLDIKMISTQLQEEPSNGGGILAIVTLVGLAKMETNVLLKKLQNASQTQSVNFISDLKSSLWQATDYENYLDEIAESVMALNTQRKNPIAHPSQRLWDDIFYRYYFTAGNIQSHPDFRRLMALYK